ncbi:hypothetical protein BZG35_16040 [Brevundimonas sp. LM2]|nr:hypothetical protein BZG35_16040 [Brevundimonas sp. LM2]
MTVPISLAEGNLGTTDFTFTISRSGDMTATLTVDWDVDGLGLVNPADGADFIGGVLPGGTVTFSPGETTETITVRVAGDRAVERDENFVLRLSDARTTGTAGVSLGQGTANGRIYNDDVQGYLRISPTYQTMVEGHVGLSNFAFTLSRTGDLSQAMTVTYVVRAPGAGNGDVLADAADIVGGAFQIRTAVIPAGASSVAIVVQTTADRIVEPHETFTVQITGFTGGDPTTIISTPDATGRIFNDDGFPPVIPPGLSAGAFGDPHLITLDGLGYDFQAHGEFILIETVPGATDPFQVQVRFEPAEGSDLVSVTTGVATEIYGQRIVIDVNGSDLVRIDGVAVSLLGAPLDLSGDGQDDLFFDGSQIVVVFPGGDQLHVAVFDGFVNTGVFLTTAHLGQVRGLLGDGDGDGTRSDDFALRDGTLLAQPLDFDTLYGAFADSWRVTRSDSGQDNASQFDYAAGQNTEDFTDTSFPGVQLTLADLPADLRAAGEAAADAAGITDPLLREAAILDFALTGDDQFAAGAGAVVAVPQVTLVTENAPTLGEIIGVTAGVAQVTEGGSGTQGLNFTVYRLGDTAGETTVTYAFAGTGIDAADFQDSTALSGAIIFADGETSRTLTLNLAGDLTVEDDEAIRLTIVAPTDVMVASPFAQTVVLNDDNTAPIAVNDAFVTLPGEAVSGDVRANDSDPDGDPLNVTLVTGPASGTLVLNDSGSFTYTPNAGFVGTDTFIYSVFDGQVLAQATASIAVTAPGGGTTGDDILNGTAGDDTLDGDAGDDTLNGGPGDDILSGGTGFDAASYAGATAGVTVDLWLDQRQDTGGGGFDTLRAIEGVIGSDHADTLRGNAGTNTLIGGGGNDVLDGGAGVDRLEGGTGDDTYVIDTPQDQIVEGAGEGIDTVESYQTYTLGENLENLTLLWGGDSFGYGNALDNRIRGNTGANSLFGYNGRDLLEGGAGNDTINGGGGDDTLNGGPGDDVLLGGSGIDTASYAGASSGVTVDLWLDQRQDTGGGGFDTLRAIEGVTGSDYADMLRGNAAANTLMGGGGNDVLNGGAGVDRLEGGTGDDTYVIDMPQDQIVEGAGEGIDTVQSYQTYALGDDLENLVLLWAGDSSGFGNALDNSLVGNTGANRLFGRGGRDTLEGGDGADRLEGGNGADVLVGGTGADTFVFRTVWETAKGDGDWIMDLEAGDQVDLSAIDANRTVAGVQTFSLVDAFTRNAGEIVVSLDTMGNTIVSLDDNGDGWADGTLSIAGAHLATVNDWLLI